MIYGAMKLGGSWDPAEPLKTKTIDKGAEILDELHHLGIKKIDLADIYCAGKSEEVVGAYLKAHPGLREQLFIQSKVGIQLTGAPYGSRFNFSYDHIMKSVEGILQRLGTSYIDSLLLHRPDPLADPKDLRRAFDQLFAEGSIRAMGVSNMSKDQMEFIRASTGRKIIANQLELSLAKHEFVSSCVGFNNSGGSGIDFPIGTMEYCMLQDVQLQAWSPLAKGLYSGRELDADMPKTIRETRRIVERIAAVKGVSLEAVVLAWLMKHPAGIIPVIGTTNLERLRNCMEAEQIMLSRDEWYELLTAARGEPMP